MGNRIKQKYIPYWDWECYKSGMWSKVDNEYELLKKAIDFTSNHVLYGKYMNEVIFKWDKTMLNHLSNPMINKKAFVGHCAVCYKLLIPEYITRKAWSYLTDKQRHLANLQAKKAIKKWEEWYIKKSKTTLINGKKRCYKEDIPDEVPIQLNEKVPSYKKIALCLLKNDLNLKGLGYDTKRSDWYDYYKRIELNERKKQLTLFK